MTTKTRDRTGDRLRSQGFDRTTKSEDGYWRVRCSQCEALVINGIACHETGCPNQKHGREHLEGSEWLEG